MEETFIVFDVETTGLPKDYHASPKEVDNWPHIVQFAWIISNDNKITEKSFIIKPDKYVIPEDSIKIHNITNKDAMENGITIKSVLKEFKEDCDKANYLVAHNASFDKSVILASCYRTKSNSSFLLNKKIICTMKTTTDICKLPGKYGYKYPKLEELYYYLFNKKPSILLHNALNDTLITLDCYQELCKRNIKMI